MKTTNPKSKRRVHSEYLNNSFQTTILFLLILSITALAFTSCGTGFSDTKKAGNNERATVSNMKLSTGSRTVGPQIGQQNN